MTTKNIGIKGYDGLPFVDEEARNMLSQLGITNEFNGKKWAVFGDSISQPKSSDSLPKYYDYVADALGITVTSYAVGGSGYFKGNAVTGYGDGNIINKITNASNDYDIISFMAGVNESGQTLGDVTDTVSDTPTTLCGAVKKSIELAIEKYPNAQMFLITPTPVTGERNSLYPNNAMSKYIDKQKEIAKMYNIPVLDLHYESNLRPWNTTNHDKYYRDYCHLLEAGHKYVAKLTKQFMLSKLSI